MQLFSHRILINFKKKKISIDKINNAEILLSELNNSNFILYFPENTQQTTKFPLTLYLQKISEKFYSMKNKKNIVKNCKRHTSQKYKKNPLEKWKMYKNKRER